MMTLKQEKRKSNHPHCSFPPPAAEVIVPAISTHIGRKGKRLTSLAALDRDYPLSSPVHLYTNHALAYYTSMDVAQANLNT